MAEYIAIEQGRPPWQPAEDAELVEVLHQYDMPLIGVIRHGTSLHLFRCIEGHTDPAHLWAYTPLSPEELDRLRADDGDLDVLVAELSARRPTVLALASDGPGRHAVCSRGGSVRLRDAAARRSRCPRGGPQRGRRQARPVGRLRLGNSNPQPTL